VGARGVSSIERMIAVRPDAQYPNGFPGHPIGTPGAPMPNDSVQLQFEAALDRLVEQVKLDRSVLAALLCGSLSHDRVWAKSDIDLVLVTVDDKKVDQSELSLNADGVNVHTVLIPRGEFRRLVEDSVRHSLMQSFLAKGRLLYTHDDTVAVLWARRPAPCCQSTRHTSGSSRVETSTTPRSGSSSPRRHSPRSR